VQIASSMRRRETNSTYANDGASPVTTHWTYRKVGAGDLQQGDILKKTDALSSILREVHPHYLKADYTHFIVLTQSCDLVQRDGGACKSRYLSIAAVRPFDLTVQRALERYQESQFERILNACSQKHRSQVSQLLTRILNNNEHDFFYLHEDVELGITANSCAFLQLSIALRAMHYETCVAARIASLTEIFAAKLGWLVGNLYSRVGTEDWVPDRVTQPEFSSRIKSILDDACLWVDHEQLGIAIRQASTDLLSKGEPALRDHLDSCARPSRRERIVRAIEQVLTNEVGEQEARRLVAIVTNDPTFATLVKG
jgi:hypothetical protein